MFGSYRWSGTWIAFDVGAATRRVAVSRIRNLARYSASSACMHGLSLLLTFKLHETRMSAPSTQCES
jgi:hypothetical protein